MKNNSRKKSVKSTSGLVTADSSKAALLVLVLLVVVSVIECPSGHLVSK